LLVPSFTDEQSQTLAISELINQFLFALTLAKTVTMFNENIKSKNYITSCLE